MPRSLIGNLIYYNEHRGFGFIRVKGKEDDIFVHISEIKNTIDRDLQIGEEIKFNIVETYKGLQGKDLELPE